MTKENDRPLRLSIIVIFHNMQREAKRTLESLTSRYQIGHLPFDYEVIAIDSNSTKCLDSDMVKSFGKNFSHHKITSENPSPCRALNIGVKVAKGEIVMCIIDGARILSPGILSKTHAAFLHFENPFVYTLGMHLGPSIQNVSILDGYNQIVEDQLLQSVDWKSNGYKLFNISALAGSSKNGFKSKITESNCFSLYKSEYLKLGGFDERFVSPGGGLANLDVFNRVMEDFELQPVLLLGEATFHQIHGGVATNVPRSKHPFSAFNSEYKQIRGYNFESKYKAPIYFGEPTPESEPFM